MNSLDIVNRALIEVGLDPISSLSQANKSARTANRFYDSNRRTLLRKHNWNFATRRVELTPSPRTPNYAFDYEFFLPNDYLKIVNVSSSAVNLNRVPYKVQSVLTGNDFYSFTGGSDLQYTATIYDQFKNDHALLDTSSYTFPTTDRLTISTWFNYKGNTATLFEEDTNPASTILAFQNGATVRVQLYVNDENKLSCFIHDSSGTTLFEATSADTVSSGWNHIMLSYDGSEGDGYFYLNNVAETISTVASGNIDFGDTAVVGGLVDANDAVTADKWHGYLSQLLVTDRFLDLSDSTIRARFYSSSGKQVDFGSEGIVNPQTNLHPMLYAPNGNPTTNLGWMDNYSYGGLSESLRPSGKKGVILSDSDTLYMVYIADVTDVDQMTDDFQELMVAKLAQQFALSLVVSNTLHSEKKDSFNKALRAARTTDSMEQNIDKLPNGSWTDIRDDNFRYRDGFWDAN